MGAEGGLRAFTDMLQGEELIREYRVTYLASKIPKWMNGVLSWVILSSYLDRRQVPTQNSLHPAQSRLKKRILVPPGNQPAAGPPKRLGKVLAGTVTGPGNRPRVRQPGPTARLLVTSVHIGRLHLHVERPAHDRRIHAHHPRPLGLTDLPKQTQRHRHELPQTVGRRQCGASSWNSNCGVTL